LILTDAVPTPAGGRVDATDAAFGAILQLLCERTGADLSRYRPSTVSRRVLNRMISVGSSTFEHYLALLRADEHEALRLLDRVTIKVSRFYRNPVTFDALRGTVLPNLAAQSRGRPLRIWSAGCGCGEEPYTLAMLLHEAGIPGDVLATDIDPGALASAARGRYPSAALTELPLELRSRYLTMADGYYIVRQPVRDRVRFSRHDLTADSPPPGGGAAFDLVACRNVLIYFARAPQEGAMRALRACLADGGYLCLGEAEWPSPTVAPSLEALSLKTRIFRAVATPPAWSLS
jgi:chemotaxis methyl-accepting protein methylase